MLCSRDACRSFVVSVLASQIGEEAAHIACEIAMEQIASRDPSSTSSPSPVLNRYEVARQALKLVLNVIELDSDELTARLFAFV